VPLKLKDRIIEYFIGTKSRSKYKQEAVPYIRRYNIKKVVIDAGHGGKDPGAIGRSGLKEKDVNLDIARRLKDILQDEGIRVILTRDRDTFVSLRQRVDIANHSDADFFVSIHSNANYSSRLKGFEVYYLSKQADNIKRAQIAARDSIAPFRDMAMDSSSQELKVILWDMIYTENMAESVRLAKDIYSVSADGLNTDSRRLKSASFYVLRNTQMPALLIEVGYISNPYEEKKLGNAYYRQNIAEVLAKAILRQ
jgi:N-acetylmuramoyl-L-alanine amidase